jgi:nitrate/nitrite transporter NarK
MKLEHKNKGWMVTFAGMGINLALGILYTWSIFKEAIRTSIQKGGTTDFAWNPASLNDPYAVCCIVFAFAMIIAGKCQDKIGPRITALIGGILVGIGFIWISQTTAYMSWILGFGILVGVGIGFGYSSATPPALKWFPSKKTGFIAGIVVAGFGLASVYIAPLAKYLLAQWGLQNAMLFFGIAFLIVVCGLSILLINPPRNFSPENTSQQKWTSHKIQDVNTPPSKIIQTKEFYLLWFTYFIGAGAGLMVIGSVAGMAKTSLGELAFLAVAIMAIGNAGGRVLAGLISDKIGRKLTLRFMLCFQAVLMFAAIPLVGASSTSASVLVILAGLIGFNYGTNLSIFPSVTKDLWGIQHFGTNYGILFTAWGVGGLVMGRLSQMMNVTTHSFSTSFLVAGILLILGAVLTFFLKSEDTQEKTLPVKLKVVPEPIP